MQTILEEHTSQEDKQLIREALGGSKTALERLIKQHYSFIYNVALRFVLNPADAQDLTQEVVIKVITKLAQFNGQSSFRTWLYRIVFNHFLNSRKRKMEQVVVSLEEYGRELDSIPLVDLTASEQESLKDQVEDAKIGCMTGMLLCLSREQRLVYILGEIFSVDSKTGAVLLEISSDHFRQLLARARKDLYHFMHQQCGLVNKRNPCRCPKKTKGFIQAGWVNQQDLQFNAHFLSRIAQVVVQKSNDCDNLLEEKYAALFREHPFYDRDESKELMANLTTDKDIKAIFNL